VRDLLFPLFAILLTAARTLAAPPADGVVVFNELNYHPTAGDAAEWIELSNLMTVNVDISGWSITGGVEFTFPNGTVIAGGAQLVIAKTPGAIPGALGPFAGALSNSSDKLTLLDRNNRLMDEFSYGDQGEWPAAADGSGATLAKRDPFTASSRSENWTFSAQPGGTPGALNFPPPPPPTTTRVIARHDIWKYDASGSTPAVNWNTTAYDDSAWNSGPAGLHFGNPTIYMDGPLLTPGGSWFFEQWTGDSTSGVSSAKSYTHKIGLNRATGYTAINGVTFDSPGSNVRSGANWQLLGATYAFTNNGNGQGANNLPAGSGSRQLCEEFFYGADSNGTSRLVLSGLTPGQTYIAAFYITGFGAPGQRQTWITPRDSGIAYKVDENLLDSGNGAIVRYRYNAPGDGTMTFDFLPVVAGNTWHHYAFSNEVAPAAVAETTIAATTVASYSSQLVGAYNRQAQFTVNGAGLIDGQHGTTPDGAMWLTNGVLQAPNDPLPAEIIFDLGASENLTGMQIWNYNELNLTTRGANQVQVYTAATAGGVFTLRGTFTFRRAFGNASEPGQHIDLNVSNVRQVKFNIVSNYGGDNQFAGLSEVRFFRAGTGPPSTPPLRETIASFHNTGTNPDGTLATPGTNDPHYTNTGTGQPATVQNGHPAWLGPDGASQWTGLTGNGADNIDAAQYTFRTTFNLDGYDPATAELKLYVSVDNDLNNVLLNGTAKGIASSGFAAFSGPFTLAGPYAVGTNNVDFVWTNAGTDPNPGGLRVKWDATAAPLLARTALPSNPITTYFRRTFTPAGAATSSYRLRLQYLVDDGAAFYLNGTELHRVRLPIGALTNTTLADADVLQPKFSAVLEVPAGALMPGQPNVLAVELHQASAGNADAFFLATLDVIETPVAITGPTVRFNEIAGAAATTFFVELQNTGSTAVTLTGWKVQSSSGMSVTLGATVLAAGALLSLDEAALGFRPADGEKLFLLAPGAATSDGQVVKNSAQARDAAGRWLVPNAATPGAANTFSLNTSIVINEIMYHHAPTYLATGTTESTEEWVELYNRSGAPVLLTGWKLRGEIDFDFADGSQLAAGAYVVVARSPGALLAKFPGISVVGPFSGSLSHSDGLIRLEDTDGNPVNEVHYYDGGRWDERADGGGSSLELINPNIDNSQPESWAASDESGKTVWQNFQYSGVASPPAGSNDPTQWNEFVLGLLDTGEFLVDDISVKEVSVGNRECIQNGTFSSGDANTWRNLGTHGSHGRTVVTDDPSAPGNKVLKVVSTGATEHMHNHCETTLKNGTTYITINSANTYNISFRARWISGSPRLQTRLYFNRLARQHLLPIPQNTGTPGAQNSRFVTNPGPTLSGFAHTPIAPAANATATVRVMAVDAQGVSSVSLKWRVDGAASWNSATMTLNGAQYEAQIPAQTGGTLVQFYVEATDALGAMSTFPAAGANARAFIRWADSIQPSTSAQSIRILMATSDANFLHRGTNVMSNDWMLCTVVYRESEVFYDAAVRLRSSERGRWADTRVGFALKFDPLHKFRGAHEIINLDRSGYGRGTTGSGFGHSEIVTWHFMQRAGGVPSMYNDMVYLLAPRTTHNGSAMLFMAEFNDVWLDSQFTNGADTPTFKYELIYWPTTTDTGGVEGLKLPQPDNVNGVEFGGITSMDKEAYRWNFLIGNARKNDDFTRLMAMDDVFALTGAPYASALPGVIDIDQWLRAAAALALGGIGDNYISSTGAWHNLKLYHRADGRTLYLPWDLDFQTQSATDPLIINPDISAIINADFRYRRLYYQHLQDLINSSFNSIYLAPWVTHYQTFNTSGGNWGEILSYVDARVAYVQSQINSAYPPVTFAITTNGGANFSTGASSVTLSGSGWIDVREIIVQASGVSLPVTWINANTWQVTVPIVNGANSFTFTALDYQGNNVGTDSITITGTGSIVAAAAGNLVISELHYHPSDPSPSEIAAGFDDNDDFEFVEVRNIGTQTVNLNGCHLAGGIDYTFPNVTVAPDAYKVIARRNAAFSMRYPGVATIGEYYQPGANQLDNGGEEIALVAANGADIERFAYSDSFPWPIEADGVGRSLVLIAPKTNPDPTNPLHWRISATNHGNPGTTDALPPPANLTGDDNGNGLTNLVDYALGPGVLPALGTELVVGVPHLTCTIERQLLADANWELESANSAFTWTPASSDYEIRARQLLPNGTERLTLRALSPLAGSTQFIRSKLTVKP
jgi:Lamin Tail Domain/Domain of unknown function (DUF4457)/CotH kinase protein